MARAEIRSRRRAPGPNTVTPFAGVTGICVRSIDESSSRIRSQSCAEAVNKPIIAVYVAHLAASSEGFRTPAKTRESMVVPTPGISE